MPTKKTDEGDTTHDLIRDMFIVQLALAGVSQANIRAIVGCDMNRVTQIGKYLKSKQAAREQQ
jgi:hypothetical protein